MELTAKEIYEITSKIKENLDTKMPEATQREQNYYLRGVIDTLLQLTKKGE